MHSPSPYLNQLYEIQNLDIAISGCKDDLVRIQEDLDLIHRQISFQEAELKEHEQERDRSISSRKKTIAELQSKLNLNLETIRQYQAQLKTEKRAPVVSLLEKGISKMTADNEGFIQEKDALGEEIAKLEEESRLQLTEMRKVLDEFKAQSKSKIDALELEEIRITLAKDELEDKRKGKAAQIPMLILREYEDLKLVFGGIAIANASSGTCSCCHMQIPLQIMLNLKKKEETTHCENCRRILWIPHC